MRKFFRFTSRSLSSSSNRGSSAKCSAWEASWLTEQQSNLTNLQLFSQHRPILSMQKNMPLRIGRFGRNSISSDLITVDVETLDDEETFELSVDFEKLLNERGRSKVDIKDISLLKLSKNESQFSGLPPSAESVAIDYKNIFTNHQQILLEYDKSRYLTSKIYGDTKNYVYNSVNENDSIIGDLDNMMDREITLPSHNLDDDLDDFSEKTAIYVSSVLKKRRKKIRKHRFDKRMKKTRQERHVKKEKKRNEY